MREKLIELMDEAIDYSVGTCIEHRDCEGCPGRKYGNKCRDYLEADHLIASGVTIGKPLTEYLHPVDNYLGLKGKYLVFKADTGEQVSNCFVLRPYKDTAAVEALSAYANTTDNKTLAEDIYNWVGKGVTVQEKVRDCHWATEQAYKNGYEAGRKDVTDNNVGCKWIPVSERLPDLIPCNAGTAYSEAVIVWTDGRKAMIAVWDGIDFLCAADYWEAWGENITHWMPLPKPPKENEK